jgi:hypothetical protein
MSPVAFCCSAGAQSVGGKPALSQSWSRKLVMEHMGWDLKFLTNCIWGWRGEWNEMTCTSDQPWPNRTPLGQHRLLAEPCQGEYIFPEGRRRKECCQKTVGISDLRLWVFCEYIMFVMLPPITLRAIIIFVYQSYLCGHVPEDCELGTLGQQTVKGVE